MQDKIPSGFKAIIPSETNIINLTYNDNVIKINFNENLLKTNINNEQRIIEALIYTLTSIDEVDYIIIYINGEILTKLPQTKITLPSTLDRSFGINKDYDINNIKDLTQTTIYYISQFNDYTYYVPVTKINNDKRSKIEIIIDELSSNNIYKHNLMSYLNNKTEIISANENNDEMFLNFNNAIFNDINKKDILEEVIYSISMSIYDNYDIENLIINVENEKNKEINKSMLKTIE